MKKQGIKVLGLVLILGISVCILAGCGKEKELNIASAENSIASINSTKVQGFEKIANIEEYNISTENMKSYTFYINPVNKDFYAIITPIEGKMDLVKEEMKSYTNRMKLDEDLKIISKYAGAVIEEYNGSLIYIATTTANTEILNAIKGN